ncbi:MAG: DNA polymerase IV [Candidatus Krumholzibacteria bacterium]|nr:DNA polymerase IV [Candidatus Krumholzibacteria bacterium]
MFPDRAILHIDMDAFYASVEVLDDPSLKGKPVMVGGTPEGRGVVAAASYEAREYGVHSAMSAARAIKLCPEGIFLRGRMDRYSEISGQVFAIFGDYTPLVEPLSIDEAFLDVTGCRRLFGSAEKVGRAIKGRILEEIGLVASVGLAANKFLAKLASDLEKPDGFTIILPDQARPLLASLPIGKLWGVGKVAEKQMHQFGIRKVEDLLAVPRDLVVGQFGDHAAHLLELAVGYDERPVIPVHEAKSIGNETTFREDISEAGHLQDILDQLAAKVARRLRSHGFMARTVTLKARYPDFTTHTRSETLLSPSDSSVEFRDAARRLLSDKLGRRARPLRLIGVTASNLVHEGEGQAQLFPDPDRERDRKLDSIMDRVHGKFGPMLKRGGHRE